MPAWKIELYLAGLAADEAREHGPGLSEPDVELGTDEADDVSLERDATGDGPEPSPAGDPRRLRTLRTD